MDGIYTLFEGIHTANTETKNHTYAVQILVLKVKG